MQTDIDNIVGEVESALDAATSYRKFSRSRIALFKAIDILNDAAQDNLTPYDNRKLRILYLKLAKAFRLLPLKQSPKESESQQNSATSLLLRCKLKPTQDGKDASTDNKAADNTQSFFINLGNLTHVQSQNRAFA